MNSQKTSSVRESRRRGSRGAWYEGATSTRHWTVGPAEWTLILLAAGAAMMFGGIDPSTQALLAIGVTLLVALTCVRLFSDRTMASRLHASFIPVGLFLSLITVQLIDLGSLVGLLSPATQRLRAEVLPEDVVSSVTTLSLYPHATAGQLRVVLMASAVFFVVVQMIGDARQLSKLASRVMWFALALAVFAIAQTLSGSPNIYFVGPPGRGVATGGPFVHYSHFGQFMVLCVGITLAGLLMWVTRLGKTGELDLGRLSERWRQSRYRRLLVALLVIALAGAAVLLSGSRSASIALVTSGGLALLLMGRHKLIPGRGWLMFPTITIAVAIVALLGADMVVERLGLLAQRETFASRTQIWSDVMPAIASFPMLGTGLGSFEVIYPQYDNGTIFETATHAENQYVQMLLETGVVGVLIIVSFVALLVRTAIRVLRRPTASAHVAMIGLVMALMASLIHAVADFALHMPANAILMAIVCGLIVSVARMESLGGDEESTPVEASASGRARLACRLIAVGLLASCALWLVPGAWASRQADQAFAQARPIAATLEALDWEGDDRDYTDLIRLHERMVEAVPGDVQLRYQLNHVRWMSITRDRDASGRALLGPEQVAFARRITQDIDAARPLAPTYQRLVALSAEINRAIDPPRAAADDELAFRLNRLDVAALRNVLQRAASRRDAAAVEALGGRLIQLTNDRATVASIYFDVLSTPEKGFALFWDQTDQLPALESMLRERLMNTQADQVRTEYMTRLQRNARLKTADPDQLIALAQATLGQGDIEQSIALYRRALEVEYDHVEWRLGLAALLQQAGRLEESAHELRICLRIQPDNATARSELESAERRLRLGNMSGTP